MPSERKTPVTGTRTLVTGSAGQKREAQGERWGVISSTPESQLRLPSSWSPSPTQPHIVPHLCTLPLCASGRLPTIPFQIWHGQPGWLLPPCSEPPLRKHGPCVCPSPTSNPLWPHPLGPWLGTPGHTRTRVPTRPTGPVQCYRASLMPPCPKAGKMPP